MAQTVSRFVQEGEAIDYTPNAAVTAGDVVVISDDLIGIATHDIAASVLGSLAVEGVFDVPKVTGAISLGDKVYWDADASPVTGDASSGAASKASGGSYLGVCVSAALSGDARVRVLMSKSLRNNITTATVAAAGSTQTDAASLDPYCFTLVSGADDAKGVKLPAAAAGRWVIIKVGDGADLKVWPATGDAINALGANNSMTVVDDVCFALVAYDATTWYTLPLLPS